MPQQFEFLILHAPERLQRQGRCLFAVRLDSRQPELAPAAEYAIVAAAGRKRSKELLKLGRAHSRRVLLQVSTADEAALAADLGFDGIVSAAPLASSLPVWGAGGIGLQIAERIKVRYWDEVSFIIILILITVAAIDFLSARVRRKLIA